MRAEVLRWGLGDTHVDPGETLLKLVAQSAARAEHYARLLNEAYDAAERLQRAHDARQLVEVPPEKRYDDEGHLLSPPAGAQQALADLDRIFGLGGVAALVGSTYAATRDGDLFATGEAIRGLAKLEAEERDRCAGFAAKAVAAGLAVRQVKLAEDIAREHGRMIAQLLRSVMGDAELGMTEQQRRALPKVARRHLGIASEAALGPGD